MPAPHNPFRERNRYTFISFVKLMVVLWTIFSIAISFHLIPSSSTSTSHDSSSAISVSISNSHMSSDKGPNSSSSSSSSSPPVVVAYAVSFIKCGDKQTHSAGLVDASLILRHSIHQISSRNPASGSKYDYKMYAIVHEQAKECSARLREVGFDIVVVKPPIQPQDIQGEYLRKTVHKEWCCGHDEFVKLYAYTLPHDIIVHVDIDFAFYKPMDHLFDAILYDKDSVEGKRARDILELERPGERLPDTIGAFLTRDWPQVAPGKFPPAYQAGFLVARRDPDVMDQVLDIIREGNYTDGWGYGSGWHGSGHGGYVGARAMQGVMAYFYDYVKKDNAVELNQCRHNHMGMDVLYRTHPNYMPNRVAKDKVGGCRNGLDYCEDCQVTDFDKIYSVHYTMCRKPWQCMAEGTPSGKNFKGERGKGIPVGVVKLEHCYMLNRHWHELRSDFEKKLYALTGDETIFDSTRYDYKKDVFLGHCSQDGNEGYHVLSGTNETFQRVSELYNNNNNH